MKILERLGFYTEAMAFERSEIVNKLNKMTDIDSYLYHVGKIILWGDLSTDWYDTVAQKSREIAMLKLSKKGYLERSFIEKHLFNLMYENAQDFDLFLEQVKSCYEGKKGSNGRVYKKARDWNVEKVWRNYQKWQEEILDRITAKDKKSIFNTLSKESVRKLCDKYFSDIE